LSPSPESCPALVLNADFRPLSYFPLSLWSWQDTVKAVFLDRVSILSEYDRVVHSPSFKMKLPSVIALKEYIATSRYPAFTRFNVFLRDSFSCQYCGHRRPTPDLTFDHVVPRSKGGRTVWEKGQPAARAVRYASAAKTVAPAQPRIAGKRPRLSAELPA
jgi:hypothetical protein